MMATGHVNNAIILTKWFRIKGSHRIECIEGPCSKTHGHDWKIGVAVTGPIDGATLLAADTNVINAAFWSLFDSDHVDWNERLGCKNATTEAIAIFIRGQLGISKIGHLLHSVTVCESDGLEVRMYC